MSGANGICFICVRECIHDEISLDTVVHNDEHNITEVKYVFPELAFLLAASIPAYICCSCRTTLHSFYMFKKRCLENYGRLIRNTNILQGVGAAVSATETAREPGVKLEPDVHMELVSEEEHEAEPDNHTTPAPEHSVHQHSYRPLEFIKCETDLGNEQEGGFISEGEDQLQDDTQEDALSLYNIAHQTQHEHHSTHTRGQTCPTSSRVPPLVAAQRMRRALLLEAEALLDRGEQATEHNRLGRVLQLLRPSGAPRTRRCRIRGPSRRWITIPSADTVPYRHLS